MDRALGPPAGGIRLRWIPLGAGGHVVSRCGRGYERLIAGRERRDPLPLYHAALEVDVAGTTYVVEMAPAWHVPAPERGVVRTGPVGLRVLGRWRLFRYEVRCWPGGVIPDRAWATGPLHLSGSVERARRVLLACGRVPGLTWGRDELGAGEMWNSNSLVAWLLAEAGLDAAGLAPPGGGRAPGWAAGLALAALSASARRQVPA